MREVPGLVGSCRPAIFLLCPAFVSVIGLPIAEAAEIRLELVIAMFGSASL